MDNLFSLSGKAAVVTGAARGLGKAIAVGLANAGADVLVSDVLDTSEVVKEIEKLGKKAVGMKTDVSKKEDVAAMVKKAVETFGKIDILVNNAGIVRMGKPSEELDEKDWDDVIRINLKGEFLCAQEAGKQMIKQKSGKIINIASIAGLGGFAQIPNYCASKAGVILMTKTLAVDWGKYNIQVNAICPGVFVTPMTEDMLKDDAFSQSVKAKTPLGRAGVPDELVGSSIYLASNASNYTTGHALVVDGGWTAGI